MFSFPGSYPLQTPCLILLPHPFYLKTSPSHPERRKESQRSHPLNSARKNSRGVQGVKVRELSNISFKQLLLSHSVVSDSVRPHRRQPTRLLCPWDSPGKNTGVGCHFLLQCMTVKSESEVTQLCLTLSDPMDCSLPGSSVHGIFQARGLEWGVIAFSSIVHY